MSNIQILIPSIIMFISFFSRGLTLIFIKPSLKAIEIQNKYRKIKGKQLMDDEDIQKLFIKHRIIGVMLFISAIGQLAFGIIILPT